MTKTNKTKNYFVFVKDISLHIIGPSCAFSNNIESRGRYPRNTHMLHTHMVVSLKFPDLYFHLSPRHKYMTLGFLNVCTYVQAICDARQRFVFVSMDMPGATHDSRAFSFSVLWAALQIGLLISGYYILGYAAYRGTCQIFTPYIGNVSDEESVFSFYHSSIRMCIECSFGILVGRWGILWKPLRVPLRRAPVVIETCMTLHNLCIDRSVPQEIRPPKQSRSRDPSHHHHINNNGGPSSLLTDDDADSAFDSSDMNSLRSFITQQMKDLEMKRPAFVTERQRAQRTQEQRKF